MVLLTSEAQFLTIVCCSAFHTFFPRAPLGWSFSRHTEWALLSPADKVHDGFAVPERGSGPIAGIHHFAGGPPGRPVTISIRSHFHQQEGRRKEEERPGLGGKERCKSLMGDTPDCGNSASVGERERRVRLGKWSSSLQNCEVIVC